MIELQYFDGKRWETISSWTREELAWASLGGDDLDYRTVDAEGKVLTSKQQF